ncbi:hypothetical protein Ddye_003510 [Dipteronia dyeriana]|uniref:Uncharacterized protein n=1 Tax=Dipteronia dyeriana TaxID=168575 RepID=A0AAD9XSD2_9ROSI|nr:hypothetical protein Ddye_003510 [Dipteronia dyeriana]
MSEKGVMMKHPGCSWINIKGVVHEFIAGSPSHPEVESIYYLRWIAKGDREGCKLSKRSQKQSMEIPLSVIGHSYGSLRNLGTIWMFS